MARRKPQGKTKVDPEKTIKPWEEYLHKEQTKEQKNARRQYRAPLHVSKTLPQLKRTRLSRLVRNVVIVLAILLTIGGSAAYFLTPFSRVREISVTGTTIAADQAVIDQSGIRSGAGLFHVFLHRQDYTRHLLKQMPLLKKVAIKRTGINDIVLQVKEYPVVGYAVKAGIYHPILSTGTVVSGGQSKPVGNYPVYADFTKAAHLQAAVKVYASLAAHVQTDISEIHDIGDKDNPNRVMLYLNDGNKVIADLDSLKQKMVYYPAMKAQLKGPGIVDLEVGAYAVPNSTAKDTKKP
ncbi:cell division protein FtsQ/DivIB [Schleiferilactobacillus shenzhenensis]|uniref:Cell division protein DivIB n=1 Tax=Schleiferilactobacillus shenzhenensis LY-73 TaxID=1231336 RepID=U4TYT8_9LACO|nr:cell division protein FtsQ/DivIB [Schleiferilactobacillus shenzhenensis]ERL66477.1 hypothetical protein L248_0156 [Schleiferilactobacillus shenzhenensis LY-73]